jgi:hypothetical protein
MKIQKEKINEDLQSFRIFRKDVENVMLFPDYSFYRYYSKNKDLRMTSEFQFIQNFIKNQTETNNPLYWGSFYKVNYAIIISVVSKE